MEILTGMWSLDGMVKLLGQNSEAKVRHLAHRTHNWDFFCSLSTLHMTFPPHVCNLQFNLTTWISLPFTVGRKGTVIMVCATAFLIESQNREWYSWIKWSNCMSRIHASWTVLAERIHILVVKIRLGDSNGRSCRRFLSWQKNNTSIKRYFILETGYLIDATLTSYTLALSTIYEYIIKMILVKINWN